MQVEVSHEQLTRALKIASKTVSRRPTLPVLAGARLETFDGHLKVTTTDLETTSTTTLGAATPLEASAPVVVPALELAAALKGHQPKGTTVTLASDDENGELTIAVQGMTVRLRMLDPDDYPTVAPEDSGKLVTSDLGLVTTWATRVLPAASTDEARPVLTAVSIERHGDEQTAAATDGCRLHTYTTRDDSASEDHSILVPARALRLATDIAKIGKATSGSLRYQDLSPSAGQAIFKLGQTTLWARCLEGEFPPWHKLVPTDHDGATLHVTDPDALRPVLDMAAKHAARHDNMPIRLEQATDGSVLGTMRTQDVSTIELPLTGLKVSGETALDPVAYNPTYLRDMVAAAGQATVQIRPDLKPAVFEDGNGFRGLLMPVRIA